MQSDPYQGGRTAPKFYSIAYEFFAERMQAGRLLPGKQDMIYFLGC
ncbi:hypothetical protein ACFQNF_16775 [Iodobacter arcticus]|uniref:Uncharacterized protein n=1 Tax=Iodobacter arcticus TaxID=590593 RepID=A0ABW2R138_9NEIS